MMYTRDQAAVERWAARSSWNTIEVILMVLLSIRMQWVGVGGQLKTVRSGYVTPLWGSKAAGWQYLQDNRERIYKRVKHARHGRIWVEDLFREMLKVPGLGLAKAGFAVQLLIGEVGCLDMHNLERLGLDASITRIPKRADPDAQLRVIDECIERYMWACDEAGGSEVLWNEWCEHMADTYGSFENADDVSRRHIEYLVAE